MTAKESRPPDLPPNYDFVRPIVDSRIGRPVVLARHRVLATDHVIKFYLPTEAEDTLAYKEPRVMVRMRHARIVPIYDAGHIPAANHVWIATAYLPDGSLFDKVEDWGRWSTSQICSLIIDVLEGLQHVHVACKTLHRDIKPGNILLKREQGRFVGLLADFGSCARMDEAGEASPSAGAKLYRAPEVTNGGRASVRSEVYSAGLVLHEIIGGRLLQAMGRANVINKLKTGQSPIAGEQYPVHVPRRIVEAINRATDSVPSKRYQSVAEFRRALRACLNFDAKQEIEGGAITWTFLSHSAEKLRLKVTIVVKKLGPMSTIEAHQESRNGKSRKIGRTVKAKSDLIDRLAQKLVRKSANSPRTLEEVLQSALGRTRQQVKR